MHVKALFQKLKVWPSLTPEDSRQFHLCSSGGLQAIQDDIWATVLLGERTTAWGTAKDHCPGRECWSCCFLIQLTFPWIPNPLPTLCSPYKKGHFKMEFKMVPQGMNPPSSQISGHLNKVPIKTQPLSLLIELGSYRQPELPCLFWFQSLYKPGSKMKFSFLERNSFQWECV